jgi:hypothetical protein
MKGQELATLWYLNLHDVYYQVSYDDADSCHSFEGVGLEILDSRVSYVLDMCIGLCH